MAEYTLRIAGYTFNCPACDAEHELSHKAKGVGKTTCQCGAVLTLDMSPLPMLYTDAEKTFALGKEQYDWGNFKEARPYFETAAECNHPLAIYYLSILYAEGLGVQQDKEIRMAYLERAAHLGCNEALLNLGNILCDQGDTARAAECYKKAIKKGDKDAMFAYALLFDEDDPNTPDEVFRWLERAGDLGISQAYNRLGNIYCNMGDIKKGIEWYIKSANAGGASGQFNLGRIYCYGKELGDEYPDAQPKVGFDYIQLSARQFYAPAMVLYASYFKKGELVNQSEPVYALWIERAASQGNALGQLELAIYYAEHNEYDKCFYWLNESRNQGYSLAERYYPEMVKRAAANGYDVGGL